MRLNKYVLFVFSISGCFIFTINMHVDIKSFIYSNTNAKRQTKNYKDEWKKISDSKFHVEKIQFPEPNRFINSVKINKNSLEIIRENSSSKNFLRNYHLSNLEDINRSNNIPWRKITQCRHLRTRFALPNSLPKCGLVSFPGSGNTWIRYLIESSTGIFSGTVTPDSHLYAAGFLGEIEPWHKGTTVIQKVHDKMKKTVEVWDGRAILVIRNPYKAILSYHNLLYTDHKRYAPMVTYRSKDWEQFVINNAKSWMDTFNTWMKNSKKLLVIYYENLFDEPIKYLEEINSFLGFPNDEGRIKCIMEERNGHFKRKNQFFSGNFTLFSKKSRNLIDTAIDYLDFMSKSRRYPSPPLEKYEFYKGAPSKLQLVPCKITEDFYDCDNRIDGMNLDILNPFYSSTKQQDSD